MDADAIDFARGISSRRSAAAGVASASPPLLIFNSWEPLYTPWLICRPHWRTQTAILPCLIFLENRVRAGSRSENCLSRTSRWRMLTFSGCSIGCRKRCLMCPDVTTSFIEGTKRSHIVIYFENRPVGSFGNHLRQWKHRFILDRRHQLGQRGNNAFNESVDKF